MADGFSRIGVPLSISEFDRVWKDISGNNPRIKGFDYGLFKAFYERYDTRVKQPVNTK